MRDPFWPTTKPTPPKAESLSQHEFSKQFLGDFSQSHIGKVYAGEEVFFTLKEKVGILYGRQFSWRGVTVVLERRMPPGDLITLDPDIGKVFDELNEKLKD